MAQAFRVGRFLVVDEHGWVPVLYHLALLLGKTAVVFDGDEHSVAGVLVRRLVHPVILLQKGIVSPMVCPRSMAASDC